MIRLVSLDPLITPVDRPGNTLKSDLIALLRISPRECNTFDYFGGIEHRIVLGLDELRACEGRGLPRLASLEELLFDDLAKEGGHPNRLDINHHKIIIHAECEQNSAFNHFSVEFSVPRGLGHSTNIKPGHWDYRWSGEILDSLDGIRNITKNAVRLIKAANPSLPPKYCPQYNEKTGVKQDSSVYIYAGKDTYWIVSNDASWEWSKYKINSDCSTFINAPDFFACVGGKINYYYGAVDSFKSRDILQLDDDLRGPFERKTPYNSVYVFTSFEFYDHPEDLDLLRLGDP